MLTTLHPERKTRQAFDPVSRLSAVRDLAIVAVCIAIVAGFLAQVWSLPRPHAGTALRASPPVLASASA